MEGLFLPLTCLCTPTTPGMSYPSYSVLKPCFIGQAALPLFLGQELGVGLGQVTEERLLGSVSVLGDLQNSNVLIQCLQQS